MTIGQRITYYRTLKNYSVNKLANLAGISQSYLRDIELGNKNPTVETLSYICDALDLSLKDFFDDATASSISSSSLLQQVYKLSPKQQEALIAFIEAMTQTDS